MMIDRKKARVFLDTNILIFAEGYQRENIFEWIDKLYSDVWIHADVLNEMLLKRAKIEQEICNRNWNIFDSGDLESDEQELYQVYISEIESAFQRMNQERAASGGYAKNTADTGEIATLAVCILQDAQLICSNDKDISEVVQRENYCYVDEDGQANPILQDTARDFCYHCVQDAGVKRSEARRFYKTLFEDSNVRQKKLEALDHLFAN